MPEAFAWRLRHLCRQPSGMPLSWDNVHRKSGHGLACLTGSSLLQADRLGALLPR